MFEEIDDSTLLFFLETTLSDEAMRQEIIDHMYESTGVSPENVVIILTALRDWLASRLRSNN